jgi:hypothetical protein
METRETDVTTPDGVMGAYEIIPDGEGPRPAIVFLMDGLGYRAALKTMAERLASHGGHARSTSRAWPSGETSGMRPASRAHDALGLVARERSAVEEARRLDTLALEGHRAAGDSWGMAGALSNLGVVAEDRHHRREPSAEERRGRRVSTRFADAHRSDQEAGVQGGGRIQRAPRARSRRHDDRAGRGACVEPDQGPVSIAVSHRLGQESRLGERARKAPREATRRESQGREDAVRAGRRGPRDPARRREGSRAGGSPAPDPQGATRVPRTGSDPRGAADPDRGVTGAVPDQATVLVPLRPGGS